MSSTLDSNNGPVRMPKKEHMPFRELSLIVFSVLTGILIFLSVVILLQEDGFWGIAKAAIIALAASLVSYGVNRFALEKGAELAATGFTLAGIISVVSILAVGAGQFPSTYAGMTLNSVEELRLQKFLDDTTRYGGTRNEVASEASRLAPVVEANVAELERYRQCEESNSCISSRGDGGYGPVAKALEGLLARATDIAKLLKEGTAQRTVLLTRLNDLIAQGQTELGNTDKPIRERRQELVKIDARIDQVLSELDEALPVALLQAYAAELSGGVTIADRPIATERLNAVLSRQGQALTSVLSSLSNADALRPDFPAKAGVSTTFEYLGNFWVLASVAGSIELVYPLALWFYTLFSLVWAKHKIEQARAADGEDSTPPWNTTPNGHSPRGRRGRSPDHSGRFN